VLALRRSESYVAAVNTLRRALNKLMPGPVQHSDAAVGVGFVSLLSDNGTSIDEIARLVGHSSTAVTELVYRQQIRPVLQSGAVVMDRIFGGQLDA
jgi:integrase